MNGLFGRQSGTTAGYSYSAANKNMAVMWEENTLYDYLLNPKKVQYLWALIFLIISIFFYVYPDIFLTWSERDIFVSQFWNWC